MARGAIVIPGATPSAIAVAAHPILGGYGAQVAAPMARVRCKPFEKPISPPQSIVGTHSKTVKYSPYSTGLKPEAIDKLPPLDPKWLLSKPEPRMSESAQRLHMLKFRLQCCMEERKYDDLVFETECRLKEQAAFIIGWGA